MDFKTIKYVGMIQNICEVEYLFSRENTNECTGVQQHVQCVPIPGLNSWAKKENVTEIEDIISVKVQAEELEFKINTIIEVDGNLIKDEDETYIIEADKIKEFSFATLFDEEEYNFKQIRQELISYLAESFSGDKFAGEYLLVTLLSQVYTHQEGLNIGAFPINFINFPETSEVDRIILNLVKTLDSVVTQNLAFPLSIEKLNTTPITPIKDYNTERLIPGLLQLPKNTVLLLDETKLTEGQLNSKGLESLKCLRNVAIFQTVPYDFTYYSLDMPTDINVIVISLNKSLLNLECIVPVNFDEDEENKENNATQNVNQSIKESGKKIEESMLKKFRWFIQKTKSLDFQKFDQKTTDFLVEDFTELRKTEDLSPETFHTYLVLARILAISFGESTLTKERWDYMKVKERARNQRVTMQNYK